jgi:2-dehydropantoate 2-reductase
VQLFHSAGVKTVLCPDYRAQKWSKLLLNMLANAVPAILDMPPGAVFSDPRLFAIERAACLEALDVMHALQLRPVGFPDYPVPVLAWAMRHLPEPILQRLLRRLVAGGRGEKKPSLQIDLLSGRRRSEVLYLNGAVVTYAVHLGLAAPVNQVLVDTLLGIAAVTISWHDFRGKPERLVAEVSAAKGE